MFGFSLVYGAAVLLLVPVESRQTKRLSKKETPMSEPDKETKIE
jgi:hypothetical protein